MIVGAELEIVEVAEGWAVNLLLPDTFDYSSSIMGISIQTPEQFNMYGIPQGISVIETTNGMVGVKLTKEQHSIITTLKEGYVPDSIKVCNYPENAPTPSDPTLISFVTKSNVEEALTV